MVETKMNCDSEATKGHRSQDQKERGLDSNRPNAELESTKEESEITKTRLAAEEDNNGNKDASKEGQRGEDNEENNLEDATKLFEGGLAMVNEDDTVNINEGAQLFLMYRAVLREYQKEDLAIEAYEEFQRNTIAVQENPDAEIPNAIEDWTCLIEMVLATNTTAPHVDLLMYFEGLIPLNVRQYLFDTMFLENCRRRGDAALKTLSAVTPVPELFSEMQKFVGRVGTPPTLDLSIVDAANNCPIHLACLNGSLKCVQCLVELNNDDVNRRSRGPASSGATPLHAAAMGGHVDIIEYLLHCGAEPSPVANDGTSPLHLACARNHADAVCYLMQHTDQDPFKQPVRHGHLGNSSQGPANALQNGFSGEATQAPPPRMTGLSAFETAAIFGANEAVKAILNMVSSDVATLVRKSSEINRQGDGKGANALGGTSAVGRQGLVPFMFKSMLLALSSSAGGAPESEQDERRAEILLQISEFLPRDKVIKLLAMHYKGAPGRSEVPTEIQGDTLLHVSARLGRGCCVMALLAAGADITVRNVKGETAVDCAMPFIADPNNGPGQQAVRVLIKEWERRRVDADRTMEALVNDSNTESSGNASHDAAGGAGGTGAASASRRRRNKRNKKKAKRRATASTVSKDQGEEAEDNDEVEDGINDTPQHDSSSRMEPSTDEEDDEESNNKLGTIASSSSRTNKEKVEESRSSTNTLHATSKSSIDHAQKKINHLENNEVAQTSAIDDGEWIPAHGGKVKFSQQKASSQARESLENERKLELRKLLDSTLQESLSQHSKNTSKANSGLTAKHSTMEPKSSELAVPTISMRQESMVQDDAKLKDKTKKEEPMQEPFTPQLKPVSNPPKPPKSISSPARNVAETDRPRVENDEMSDAAAIAAAAVKLVTDATPVKRKPTAPSLKSSDPPSSPHMELSAFPAFHHGSNVTQSVDMPSTPPPAQMAAEPHTLSPFGQREIFDIGRFMQQFAGDDESVPFGAGAWEAPTPPAMDFARVASRTDDSMSSVNMPNIAMSHSDSNILSKSSSSSSSNNNNNNYLPPPASATIHDNRAFSVYGGGSSIQGDSSVYGSAQERLFEQLNPEAGVLGLTVEHFLGLNLGDLSMSQLDTLRQLHQRLMDDIMETQLNLARSQGKEIAQEDQRRRANFTTFQQHYFGGLDG